MNLGGILNGLAGAGSAQGYYGPEQTLQRKQDDEKKAKILAVYQMMQQQQKPPPTAPGAMLMQAQQGPPGGINSPQGGPVPISGGSQGAPPQQPVPRPSSGQLPTGGASPLQNTIQQAQQPPPQQPMQIPSLAEAAQRNEQLGGSSYDKAVRFNAWLDKMEPVYREQRAEELAKSTEMHRIAEEKARTEMLKIQQARDAEKAAYDRSRDRQADRRAYQRDAEEARKRDKDAKDAAYHSRVEDEKEAHDIAKEKIDTDKNLTTEQKDAAKLKLATDHENNLKEYRKEHEKDTYEVNKENADTRKQGEIDKTAHDKDMADKGWAMVDVAKENADTRKKSQRETERHDDVIEGIKTSAELNAEQKTRLTTTETEKHNRNMEGLGYGRLEQAATTEKDKAAQAAQNETDKVAHQNTMAEQGWAKVGTGEENAATRKKAESALEVHRGITEHLDAMKLQDKAQKDALQEQEATRYHDELTKLGYDRIEAGTANQAANRQERGNEAGAKLGEAAANRQERGRESDNKVSEGERGQDMKATQAAASLKFRQASAEEKNKIITSGQDKSYKAKMAEIAAKGTKQQSNILNAAIKKSQEDAAAYQRSIAPGMGTGNETLAATAFKSQQDMENIAAGMQGDAPPDPSLLEEKTMHSFDNGKTYWYLKDGKPLQVKGE